MIALAVYELIAEKKLKLAHKLQDILHLETTGGAAPADARFQSITIRHLLEHTSGIDANAFNGEVAIRDAFKAAQPGGNWHLPVSEAMCDSYIASLAMVSDPGKVMAYNNCAYYLLGRVVAKKRGQARPIDTLQDHLFDPLFIHRIRRAPTSIPGMPFDEARYRGHDIPVAPSVLADCSRWSPRATGISTSSGWRGAADCPPPPPTWGA